MKRLFRNRQASGQQGRKRDSTVRRRPAAPSARVPINRYGSLWQPSSPQQHTKKGRQRAEVQAVQEARRLSAQHVLHASGAAILSIILLLCAISLLQVDTKPRVIVVNDSEGYALHSTDDYAAAATDAMRGSLFNTNKITIDAKSITQAVQQTFPEVNEAAIALPLVGHRPTLYIELTKPVLVLNTSTQSVVVDSSGHALVTAQSVNDLASFHLPSLLDQSQLPLKVGDVVLSSHAVGFIQTILAQLAYQHLRVDRMVLPAASAELDIYLKGDSYFTKYNIHETNARQQVGTFLAVRKQLSKQKGVPAHYIDVRLAGRAYYK